MREIGLATAIVVARDAVSADDPAGGQELGKLDCAKVCHWPAGPGGAEAEPWGVWIIFDHYEDGLRQPGTALPLLVPVASMTAGHESGTQFLPRIGTSVYLRFVDNDGEQPVIIGFARHAGTPYPFPPDQDDLPLVPADEDGVSLMRHVVKEEAEEEEEAEEAPEPVAPPMPEMPDPEAEDEGGDEEGGEEEAEEEGGEEDESPDLDVPATVEAVNGAESADDAADAVPDSETGDGEKYNIAPGEAQPLDVTASGCNVTGMTSNNGRNHVIFDDGAPQVVIKADNLHATYVGGDHMVNVRGDMHRVTGATETLHEGIFWHWSVGKHHTRIDGQTSITRQGVVFSMVRKGELHIRYGAVDELWGGVRLEFAKDNKWTLAKPDIMQLKLIGQIALAPTFKDVQTTRLRLAVLRKHKTKTMERTSEMHLRLAVKAETSLDDLTRDVKVSLQLAQEETVTLKKRTKKGLIQIKIENSKEIG